MLTGFARCESRAFHAAPYPRYHGLADTVTRCNFGLQHGATQAANLCYIFGCTGSLRVMRRMFLAGKHFQMGRINTAAIVANMMKIMTFGDWPNHLFIVVPMGKFHLAAITLELSVPAGVEMAVPYPTSRFGIDGVGKVAAFLMSNYELARFAFDQSSRAYVVGNNAGSLPATAMAVTVWDFVRGIIEGHGDLHSRCVKPRDAETSPGHSGVPHIIPQMGGM